MEIHESHSAFLRAQNAELRAEVALLRDGIDHMHQGLCLYDPEKRIAWCNKQYAEVLQLPSSVVTPGLPVRRLIELGIQSGYYEDGMSAEEVEAGLWRNMEEGGGSFGTFRRNGKTFAVKPARTSLGNWVATFEDITPQVEAEAALTASEARLQAILNAMPDCVTIYDEDRRLVYINPRGLEMLQAPDITSITSSGVPFVPREYLRRCLQVHRRVLRGESVVWSYEVVGLQGRRHFVETNAVPFVLQDGKRGHLCISRDVTLRRESERQLRRSEERLRLVKEATGLADFEAGSDGIARVSESFVAQAGLPPGTELLSQDEWMKIVHPEDRDRLALEVATALDGGDRFTSEFRIVRPDNGDVRWILSHTKMERDDGGVAINSTGAHLDITPRKQAEWALRESEERFRLAAEAAGLGVWDYDAGTDSRDWSERLREILCIPPGVPATLEGALERLHPDDKSVFHAQLRRIREAADSARFEASVRLRDGNSQRYRWITVNGWKTRRGRTERERVIMTFRDVTDERALEERIRWSATHDPLTGLANRRHFQERLDYALQDCEALGGQVGLLLLDVDHFKQINDSLGHDAGDSLLKHIAQRLQLLVRHNDTVARFGGDEFAIILPRLRGEQRLIQLAESILDALQEPFVYGGQLLDCRLSIGGSIYPVHDRSPASLLKNADLALYAAKSAGRATIRLFELGMRREMQRRATMVQLARSALGSDEILPYYQPKLDLRTGQLLGFEALLRWRRPNGRIGSPKQIEAAFEDLDVACAISDRMVRRALMDVRRWLDRGLDFGHVAINASAAEFRRDSFAENLLDQMRRADIPPEKLQLEVTETVFLGRGAEFVHRALALLNKVGVKIALDDFGTGYASLSHLKQFPVDIIKIDQSFVRDMEEDPGDEAIIRAVLNLGSSLGIDVVAEGIEHQSQADRLLQLGCNQGQGFHFSKAVPAQRVPTLLAAFRAPELGWREEGQRLRA